TLERAGLARPLAARAPFETREDDRAGALLGCAAEMLCRNLDRDLPGWRARRLVLCVGSSAGGMPSLERALETRARSATLDSALARSALYDGPLSALRPWFDAPTVQVLAACASSTVAMGLGARWLESGAADLVIAGGYDALSVFVAVGFDALGATTASALAPFRVARDGMALGEGAALVALVRATGATNPLGYVQGFSATNDAVHVTAPDPEGRGLAKAAAAALADAVLGASDIELVSAHATATIHNDAAEARAIRRTLGSAPSAPVVHPFKAVTGHCLGASGTLETLAALAAMRSGVLPAARGEGAIEAELFGRLLARNEAGSAKACLKLSSGFGGSNAALVLGTTARAAPPSPRPRRAVRVLSLGELVVAPSSAAIEPFRVADEARVARLSSGGALAATAVASALGALGSLPRARVGVVVGTTAACLEENARFHRVYREKGARAVEPKRFVRTSPNLPAGECAIAFGFLGPAFAVGGGPNAALEALLVSSTLIACGDADVVVAVVCDEVGDTTHALFSAAHVPVPPHGARAVVLGAETGGERSLEPRILLELLGGPPLAVSGEVLFRTALSKATGS
ncbi:MAG TPA: beta-ketoacyl synthase N-terminal-like domain-containing protein, partial [Polyangiaceae bacterium]|nr:beta-ketoacyl synthase N-terminal-like domain-containing protein [Polyangiaceae bacterium]